MFHKGDISNFTRPYSLRFTLPALESMFIQRKNERAHELTMTKIFIAMFCVVQALVTGYYAVYYYTSGEIGRFWVTICDTAIGISALITEYVTHQFDKLKGLRGFPLTLAGFFLSFHFSSLYREVPSATLEYFFFFTIL